MIRLATTLAALSLLVVGALVTPAQERVTPAKSKGGKPLGEPWAGVPEEFKRLKLPKWKLPDDLKQWQSADRAKTRDTVLKCLGELPPRPKHLAVRRGPAIWAVAGSWGRRSAGERSRSW